MVGTTGSEAEAPPRQSEPSRHWCCRRRPYSGPGHVLDAHGSIATADAECGEQTENDPLQEEKLPPEVAGAAETVAQAAWLHAASPRLQRTAQSQQQRPLPPKMPSSPPPATSVPSLVLLPNQPDNPAEEQTSQAGLPGNSLVQNLSEKDPALAIQLKEAMERFMEHHKALLRSQEATPTGRQLSPGTGLSGQLATATHVCKPASPNDAPHPHAEFQKTLEALPAFSNAGEAESTESSSATAGTRDTEKLPTYAASAAPAALFDSEQQQLPGAMTTEEEEESGAQMQTTASQPQNAHWSREDRVAYAASIHLPSGQLPGRGVQRFLQDVVVDTPMPEPWVIVRSSAGKVFFADKISRQTSWQHPMLPGLRLLGQACAETLFLDEDELVAALLRFKEDWLQETNAEVAKWRAMPAREGRSEYYYHSETTETSWVNPRNSALALLEARLENLQRLGDPEYLAQLRYLETTDGAAAAATSASDQDGNRRGSYDPTSGPDDSVSPGMGTPRSPAMPISPMARMEAALELLADSSDGSPDKAAPQQHVAVEQSEAAAAVCQAEHISAEEGRAKSGCSEKVLRERLLEVLLSRRYVSFVEQSQATQGDAHTAEEERIPANEIFDGAVDEQLEATNCIRPDGHAITPSEPMENADAEAICFQERSGAEGQGIDGDASHVVEQPRRTTADCPEKTDFSEKEDAQASERGLKNDDLSAAEEDVQASERSLKIDATLSTRSSLTADTALAQPSSRTEPLEATAAIVEHVQDQNIDKGDLPVLASLRRVQNADANVADSMLRDLREHDTAQDGTMSRNELLALLCGLGLSEAEGLQTLSTVAKHEWGSEERVNYAQFIAWVMELQDASARLNSIICEDP